MTFIGDSHGGGESKLITRLTESSVVPAEECRAFQQRRQGSGKRRRVVAANVGTTVSRAFVGRLASTRKATGLTQS